MVEHVYLFVCLFVCVCVCVYLSLIRFQNTMFQAKIAKTMRASLERTFYAETTKVSQVKCLLIVPELLTVSDEMSRSLAACFTPATKVSLMFLRWSIEPLFEQTIDMEISWIDGERYWRVPCDQHGRSRWCTVGDINAVASGLGVSCSRLCLDLGTVNWGRGYG